MDKYKVPTLGSRSISSDFLFQTPNYGDTLLAYACARKSSIQMRLFVLLNVHNRLVGEIVVRLESPSCIDTVSDHLPNLHLAAKLLPI